MGRAAIIAAYALMLCVVKFTRGYSPFVLTIRVAVHSQILVFSFLTISGRLVQVIPWFTYLLSRWENDLVCYLRSLCIQIFYKLAKGNQFQALWNTCCVCNKEVKCARRCRSLFYVVSKDTGAHTCTHTHTHSAGYNRLWNKYTTDSIRTPAWVSHMEPLLKPQDISFVFFPLKPIKCLRFILQ